MDLGGFLYPNKKVHVILFLGLSFAIFGSSLWGSSESLNGTDTPEGLEKELQHLLSRGMAQSQDPIELQRFWMLKWQG